MTTGAIVPPGYEKVVLHRGARLTNAAVSRRRLRPGHRRRRLTRVRGRAFVTRAITSRHRMII
jgi:hypothetical protein